MADLSQAQQHFNAIVDAELGPWLRARGFLKRGQNFHRRVGPNWEIVNVQRSTFSDRDDVRFTLNLAVAYGSLREQPSERWRDDQRPLAHNAHLKVRVGTLARGEDYWWIIGAETTPAAIGSELRTDLEGPGLAWLQARSSAANLALLLKDPLARQRQRPDELRWMRDVLTAAGVNQLADLVERERRERES